MQYVTYDPSGNLTGAFWQDLIPAHAANHIEVTAQQYAQWVTFKANAGRDGLEPAPAPPVAVPQFVTMRQARLALLDAGLLSSVDAAIAAMSEPAKSAAQIEWEYASEVQRGNGMVPAMAAALGMTESQIDDLFIAAATL